MSMEPFWTEINESTPRQGNYLPQCLVGPDPSVYVHIHR